MTRNRRTILSWLLKWSLRALALLAVLGLLVFGLVWLGIFGRIPSPDQLRNIRQEQASLVFSSDEQLIGKYFARNRTNIQYEEVPAYLIDALIATEDVRFYEHAGIDSWAMLRVLVKTIVLQDESAGGGSTITQQLAKNLFGRRRFGPLTMAVSKSKELILANRLEKVYSKEEILEMYLNTVPFGEDVYGIESAAQRYFNTTTSALSIEESAVLVGMLKANTYYNPYLRPDNATERRNVVLSQMAKYEKITEQEADSLQALPLETRYNNLSVNNPTGYFLARVRKEATALLDGLTKPDGEPWDLEKDGLQIVTTLHGGLQEAAIKARREHLQRLQQTFDRQWPYLVKQRAVQALLQKELTGSVSYTTLERAGLSKQAILDSLAVPRPVLLFNWDKPLRDTVSITDSVTHYLKMLQAAVYAIRPRTGAVLVYVGGNSFEYLPYDLVTSTHQAASTFKPFVYAAALRKGISPCEWLDNEPLVFPQYQSWSPENYDGSTGGLYSLKGALGLSMNLPTVNLYQLTGHDALLETVQRMGLTNRLPVLPAVALGSESYSLENLVASYAVFATAGARPKPYMIQEIRTADGEVLYRHRQQSPRPVLEPEVAMLMQQLLKGVVDNGTAAALKAAYQLPGDWAGKTGTAQDYGDAWFIGFNTDIVMGVWVGGRYPAIHMTSGMGSGAAAALPIFGRTLSQRWYRRGGPSLNTTFPALSDSLAATLDCEWYREENFLDKVDDFFDNLEEQFERPDDDTSRPGLLQRVFNRAP